MNGSDDLTRRISMDNDFMNYQTDDIIYIYIFNVSYIPIYNVASYKYNG